VDVAHATQDLNQDQEYYSLGKNTKIFNILQKVLEIFNTTLYNAIVLIYVICYLINTIIVYFFKCTVFSMEIYSINAIDFIFCFFAIHLLTKASDWKNVKNKSDISIIFSAAFYLFAFPFTGIAIVYRYDTLDRMRLLSVAILVFWSNIYLLIVNKDDIIKYIGHFKIAIYLVTGVAAAMSSFFEYVGVSPMNGKGKSFFYLVISSVILCRVILEYFAMEGKGPEEK